MADYIIQRLVEEDIRHTFLVTGRGILYLSDAVARNMSMKGISTYHEQGASYAAMAYALAKDAMGACLVSTGCAAANAVTAALCAWQDNIPCIFISGQHMLEETTYYSGAMIRTYGSQEADIISIVKPVTKYAVMLTNPDEIAAEMDKAFYFAKEGRKGPVWIDVPLDIQNMRINPEILSRYGRKDGGMTLAAADSEVFRVKSELEAAKRPVLLAGGGVRSANAQQEIKAFAEKYCIPVVFSSKAADTYGSANCLSIGAVGSLGGSRAGNFAVQNADYILVLGSKLCSQMIGAEPDKFGRDAKIVVVDIDKHEHKKRGAKIDRVIIDDVKNFMSHLNHFDLCISCEDWVKKCLHWKDIFAVRTESFLNDKSEGQKIDLYYFADIMSQRLPENATVITDAGLEELIIPSAVQFKAEQRCLFPAAQGAMGYAIPAVVGAHYAGRENLVVIVGDGSVMMNLQEMQTISWHEIPVKIFVINNNMYAVIRKRQKDLFRNRTIGNDPSDGLGTPDFKKIAESFGILYRIMDGMENVQNVLDEVFKMRESCICEVMCKEQQNYLHSSYRINEARRLVRPPIEDLAPFLERDVFLSEMVIDPV